MQVNVILTRAEVAYLLNLLKLEPVPILKSKLATAVGNPEPSDIREIEQAS